MVVSSLAQIFQIAHILLCDVQRVSACETSCISSQRPRWLTVNVSFAQCHYGLHVYLWFSNSSLSSNRSTYCISASAWSAEHTLLSLLDHISCHLSWRDRRCSGATSIMPPSWWENCLGETNSRSPIQTNSCFVGAYYSLGADIDYIYRQPKTPVCIWIPVTTHTCNISWIFHVVGVGKHHASNHSLKKQRLHFKIPCPWGQCILWPNGAMPWLGSSKVYVCNTRYSYINCNPIGQIEKICMKNRTFEWPVLPRLSMSSSACLWSQTWKKMEFKLLSQLTQFKINIIMYQSLVHHHSDKETAPSSPEPWHAFYYMQ